MKQIILSLLFLITITANCQIREMHIKANPVGDIPYWFANRVETCDQINLEQVHLTEHPWYFRVSTDKQSISIWKDIDDNYFGTVTNWTEEYVPENEEPTNRIHFNSVHLDSLDIHSILDLIDSGKIQNIPDEDVIDGWQQGFDGIVYIVEFLDETDYHMKTYWSPTAQDSLPEAIRIQDFVDRVWIISNARKLWIDFSTTVPYECYRSGGISIACKISTRREKRKYRKERDLYRQQMQN